MASRLSQHLEVKVVLSKSKEDKVTEGKLKVNEGVSVLGVGSTVPSYVGDPAKAWSARVKLFGLKTVWSQEISVSGEKTKDTRLVKVYFCVCVYFIFFSIYICIHITLFLIIIYPVSLPNLPNSNLWPQLEEQVLCM